MDRIRTDVVVVGAGPIGLELAVALKGAGVDYVHLDAKQIGYTISWFPPQTRFFSSNERIAIAGVPLQTADQSKASREEYLAYLRSVVEQFDLKVHTYAPVVGIQKNSDGFLITAHKAGHQKDIRARRLVLCTGGTDHPRRLNIPGEDLPHVSRYLRDPHMYFRKRLLVVGGKNSAVESALRCHHVGAEVTLCYRRAKLDEKSIKYWLIPEINGLIAAGRVTGFFNAVPIEIKPGEVKLSTSQTIPMDFVLMQIGFEQDITLLTMAGIELVGDCRAPSYDARTMETNVPGVYVAGTVVGGTQDKYRVFIENCHVHVGRILASLTGTEPPPAPAPLGLPES
jgi:thioredoxin reductase (NADPH)